MHDKSRSSVNDPRNGQSAEEDRKGGLSRRDLLRGSGAILAGGAVATAILPVLGSGARAAAAAIPDGESEALQMHQDLRRALAKPIGERRFGMAIDIRKCIGCNACTVACIAENGLPPGVMYRTVAEVEDGSYPDIQRQFMPTNCAQCEKAPCIDAANKVAPGSMARRPDGIVTIDYQKMKGQAAFNAAKKACPYPGALWYDEGRTFTEGTPSSQPYDQAPAFEYGRAWPRRDTKGVTRKCHFCTQRIDAGELPACVSTCTGQAMYFGDLRDDQSVVARLLKTSKSMRMNLAAGTEPRIHYVAADPEKTCKACHE